MSSWWNKTWCCSAVLHTILLVHPLVQRHDPPVQYTNITGSCCPPSVQWHEAGCLSQVWWRGVIPSPLKNVCPLLNAHLAHTASRHLPGRRIPSKGDSPVLCCVSKDNVCWSILTLPKHLQSTWQQTQRDLRDRERMRSCCARDIPERGSSSAPGAWRGWGLPRNGRGPVLPGSSLLCFHHRVCPPSAQMGKFRENKQTHFDKSK